MTEICINDIIDKEYSELEDLFYVVNEDTQETIWLLKLNDKDIIKLKPETISRMTDIIKHKTATISFQNCFSKLI